MGIETFRWNGNAWVVAPVKRWNGNAWVDAYTRRWNGSYWVQMYPETAVSATQYISSTGTNNWRNSTWEGGAAKQGNWGYGTCCGYLGLCSKNFNGSGNITSITGAGFRGYRDGSGYYNNDQTIRFHRSNAVPGYSPDGTITGEFNATTGAPGKNGRMVDRWINSNHLGTMKDWANGIGGKDQLFIYSTSKTDYLGITSPEIGIDYTYMAKMISFESPYMMLMATPDMYMDLKGRRPYHSMLIYDDEVGMTLPELMKRRADGIVKPIDTDKSQELVDTKAWTREYHIVEKENIITGVKDLIFKIEAFNLSFDEEPQISFDNINWKPISSIKENHDDWMITQLPSDFNRARDNIYFRFYDRKKDFVYGEKVIKPSDIGSSISLL